MRKHILGSIAAGLVLMIAGCEQSSNSGLEDMSEALSIAEDEVFALKSTEATDCDVNAARFGGHLFEGSMQISGPHLFFGRSFPDCASVSIEDSEGTFPKSITIDYGDGCAGRSGLQKRGVIHILMSDDILNAGAVYTITFEDMHIGNRTVEKTATVSNQGINQAGNWVIFTEYLMTSTVDSDGSTLIITREFSEQKEWLSGFDTPEIEDDIFLKTGGGTVTINEELKFVRVIASALLVDRSCMFPLEGLIEITREAELMTIDFGEGECDNLAVVTKDGDSEEIELVSGRFKKGFQRQNKNAKMQKGWW